MPNFIKSPEDQTGISGGVASFVCQAAGEPKPRITWMKKGKKVSSQRFEVIEFDDGSGSVLRIQPLRTHRDEAIYECTATNSVGEINTSAKLTVLEDFCREHFREEEEERGAILKAGSLALLAAFHSEVDKLDAHRILQDRMNSIYSSLFIASNASFVSYSNAERPAQRRS
ncbi:Receptor-type tyrosine-protein phosphatase F [Labeo rohita]|uniref:Receptor-type tyrosine-protein phosphatase F n=1 Tax=Labeo rohita TaxID=84645 RepID=A0ABQ8MX99_LABRO|nr:Receptor-type tyrosine-protein phosphatase F [Labeo rohita]